MMRLTHSFIVVITVFLLMSCGAQTLNSGHPLQQDKGGIDESDVQLGGSEVTNPYLRKVFGRIETEDKKCPYQDAAAVSARTGDSFEVSINEYCQFETRLSGGDSYSFEFGSENSILQLLFEGGSTSVFIEPVNEDKDLGVFTFSEAVATIVQKYEEQKKAKEDFVDNVKKVGELEKDLPEFNNSYFKPNGHDIPLDNNIYERMSEKENLQKIEIPSIDIAPKKPVFPNK